MWVPELLNDNELEKLTVLKVIINPVEDAHVPDPLLMIIKAALNWMAQTNQMPFPEDSVHDDSTEDDFDCDNSIEDSFGVDEPAIITSSGSLPFAPLPTTISIPTIDFPSVFPGDASEYCLWEGGASDDGSTQPLKVSEDLFLPSNAAYSIEDYRATHDLMNA